MSSSAAVGPHGRPARHRRAAVRRRAARRHGARGGRRATATMTTLCPADEVAVAAGNAAFLRPESLDRHRRLPGRLARTARRATRATRSCSSGPGAAVQNLGLPRPPSRCRRPGSAALVSEAARRRRDRQRRRRHRRRDPRVVRSVRHTGRRRQPWANIGQAADTLGRDRRRSPPSSRPRPRRANAARLNADGDAADRVLQVYAHRRRPAARPSATHARHAPPAAEDSSSAT